MTIKQIMELTNSSQRGNCVNEDLKFSHGFASDLMSDVLRTNQSNMILITGLCNLQTIRTAEMADIKCIVLGRGKIATPDMVELAEECEICLIESPYSMFRICAELSNNGIKPLY
ncbi:MAG: hypothetical protein GX879_01470 [Bacteroidales bacterium]|nr:hypothetical protein [Bacteroidales bacterium]